MIRAEEALTLYFHGRPPYSARPADGGVRVDLLAQPDLAQAALAIYHLADPPPANTAI